MLTEDYFMRMINQVLVVLTQILNHREAGQYQDAQVLINQSPEQLLGVRPGLLKQMDDTSILRLLTTQGELDPDRLDLVAHFYKLEGDLQKDHLKDHEAVLDYQRSLSFYLEISLSGNGRGLYDLGKIDYLYLTLSGHEYPIEVPYLLFDSYEKWGDYVKVED